MNRATRPCNRALPAMSAGVLRGVVFASMVVLLVLSASQPRRGMGLHVHREAALPEARFGAPDAGRVPPSRAVPDASAYSAVASEPLLHPAAGPAGGHRPDRTAGAPESGHGHSHGGPHAHHAAPMEPPVPPATPSHAAHGAPVQALLHAAAHRHGPSGSHVHVAARGDVVAVPDHESEARLRSRAGQETPWPLLPTGLRLAHRASGERATFASGGQLLSRHTLPGERPPRA